MGIQTTLISIFSVFFMVSAFPDNLTPISTRKDASHPVFTGDDVTASNELRNVQMMKRFVIGGLERIMIASRENLFFVDPSRFSIENEADNKVDYDEIITWRSTNETRDLCLMKGQSENLCHNYLNVLETTNQNEFLLCGTNAFTPLCATYRMSVTGGKLSLTRFGDFISGRQRTPYSPNRPSASLFTGGSLYSATFQSFSGDSPVISRTMGENPPLRTSTSSDTLKEPSFVRMMEDDKRILVYFNEINKLPDGEKRSLAQVGQVCKNDVGGERVLQRTWTTFIKSRLNCSYNGFYLDHIRDITDPIVIGGQLRVFASFSTSENSLPGSAICSFTLDAIHSSMTGPFHIARDAMSSSIGIMPPVTSRHPGSCPDKKPKDSELLFIRAHTQMEKQVEGALLLTNQGSRWSAVTVDPSVGPNNVTVLFIGTEDGHLVRALTPTSKWPQGVILSEQDAFYTKKCFRDDGNRKVLQILLEDRSILVAFTHCVVSIPLRSCKVHRCKSACIGSADPYCGWNGRECVSYNDGDLSIEQDLQSFSSRQSCPDVSPLFERMKKEKEPIEEAYTYPQPQPSFKDLEKEYEVEETKELKEEQMYSQVMLIIVAAATFLCTVMLVGIVLLLWRCLCREELKEDIKYDFQKKQLEEHRRALHQDEKRGSLTRKARHTYHCWMGFLRRNVTPAPTPQVPPKNNSNSVERRQRQNEYTETPTLQHQHHVEEAKKMRKSSSRLNSTSSTTSRQDSIGCFQPSQPLLTPTISCNRDHELMLPASLTSPPAPSITGNESLTSSSNHRDGGVESGILPTASARLRRRNERAMSQTNEIMRDSDTAIRDLASALHQIEKHRFDSSPMHQIADQSLRDRLNSNDSGKGESLRNSMQTDIEQPVRVYTSRAQRPTSLHLQRSVSGNRRRLFSEPSYPYDVTTPVMISSIPEFQMGRVFRTPNGSMVTRSQPTTPNGEPGRFFVVDTNQDASFYGTLPKTNIQAVGSGRRRQMQPQQQQQQQIYHQRKSRQESLNQGIPGHASSSPKKGPPNMYPSLQVRGPYAHKMPYTQQWTSPTPPNHYPSLPHKSSSALFGNNYMTGPGFEPPTSLHRHENFPLIMRQTSAPARPGIYVPPPTVPDEM